VTCDGLAFRRGGVEILLAASCYGNQDKLWPDEPVFTHLGLKTNSGHAHKTGPWFLLEVVFKLSGQHPRLVHMGFPRIFMKLTAKSYAISDSRTLGNNGIEIYSNKVLYGSTFIDQFTKQINEF